MAVIFPAVNKKQQKSVQSRRISGTGEAGNSG